MKSILLVVLALAFSAPASFARSIKQPTLPIKQKVVLKNAEFSKLILDAIAKRAKTKFIPRAGGATTEYAVGKLLICRENVGLAGGGKRSYSYDCALRPTGGWHVLGEKIYGGIENEAYSEELYDALEIEKEVEQGIASKTISLDVPDGSGGTERNLLVCTKPLTEDARKIFRTICQVIDAL